MHLLNLIILRLVDVEHNRRTQPSIYAVGVDRLGLQGRGTRRRRVGHNDSGRMGRGVSRKWPSPLLVGAKGGDEFFFLKFVVIHDYNSKM